jgi:hypothetical protein
VPIVNGCNDGENCFLRVTQCAISL